MYEQDRRLNRSGRLVLFLGVIYLLLLAGDWFMRFHWFRWQDSLVIRGQSSVSASAEPGIRIFTENMVKPSRGGDLSRMIAISSAQARFEEERPGGLITIDPDGYRSVPYEPGQPFPIVVVGDSYMAEGVPLTNQISAQLSAMLGEPVLNRAVMGRGPFQSVMKWIEGLRPGGPFPEWLVWGFVERDVSGQEFIGFVYQLHSFRSGSGETSSVISASTSDRINWRKFRPRSLKASLPNSSSLAQISRIAWNKVRYSVFGEITPDVFVMSEADGVEAMLGYRISLDTMYWPPDIRRLDQVVWSINYIHEYLAERGVKLLVVPIPDKEQVYRDHIPESLWKEGMAPGDSIIPDLINQLNAKGIPAVSPLDAFRTSRLQGLHPYWRDDTHWNPEGIKITAELIANKIGGIVSE